MRKISIALSVFLFALFLNGCASVTKIVIKDSVQPANGMAYMILYTEYEITAPVIVDGVKKGTLTSSSPLYLQLEPGLHKIHTESPGLILDHPIAFNFKANSTNYFKIEMKQGFATFSIYIRPTEKVNSYLSNSNPWNNE